jgi:hypothetical protein
MAPKSARLAPCAPQSGGWPTYRPGEHSGAHKSNSTDSSRVRFALWRSEGLSASPRRGFPSVAGECRWWPLRFRQMGIVPELIPAPLEGLSACRLRMSGIRRHPPIPARWASRSYFWALDRGPTSAMLAARPAMSPRSRRCLPRTLDVPNSHLRRSSSLFVSCPPGRIMSRPAPSRARRRASHWPAGRTFSGIQCAHTRALRALFAPSETTIRKPLSPGSA